MKTTDSRVVGEMFGIQIKSKSLDVRCLVFAEINSNDLSFDP